jgi:hypothetical protein
MSKSYGKVGWDDNSNRNNKFAKLINGSNKVRFVSDAYKYLEHRVKFDGDKLQFGRKIKCAVNDCPLCATANPIKTKYVAAVLMGGEIKILDMSPQLYNRIKAITKNMEGYNDPTEYFVNVIRDPNGGAQNFYQAFPAEKRPLTAEEMSVVEANFDENELEEFIQPPSPEEVKSTIERIHSFVARDTERNAEMESSASKAQQVSDGVVNDGDYEFTVKRT